MAAPRIIVTGTDTDVGKTVFAAALTDALCACYWKLVQAGLDANGDSDSARVAEIDGVTIDPARLALPEVDGPLVVEGAGGVLVPLTRSLVFVEIFARWASPVLLVARTALGTINHSLLSIEALRVCGIAILG